MIVPTAEHDTPAQGEFLDDDGVRLTCTFGPLVPLRYVCSFGITVPKGKHTKDTRYLRWYKDGGFVVTMGLQTKEEVEALISVLQDVLLTKEESK